MQSELFDRVFSQWQEREGNRVVKAESGWKEPVKWNRQAECNCGAAGRGDRECSFCANGCQRPRVFCASLADIFEDWTGPMRDSDNFHLGLCARCGFVRQSGDEVCSKCMSVGCRDLKMQDVRDRLFRLIDATPNLDWLLLTKRPENIAKMMPAYSKTSPSENRFFDPEERKRRGLDHAGPHQSTVTVTGIRSNLWLGVSVENQKAADERIPLLLKTPAAVRFLSCEPLLGPVDLADWIPEYHGAEFDPGLPLDWVIVGGESGHGARLCRPEWVRSVAEQCKTAGVPVFIKQMGSNIVTRNDMIEDAFNNGESGWPDPSVEHHINGFREDYQGADCRIRLSDKKGGNMTEWPADLRVREFPV